MALGWEHDELGELRPVRPAWKATDLEPKEERQRGSGLGAEVDWLAAVASRGANPILTSMPVSRVLFPIVDSAIVHRASSTRL